MASSRDGTADFECEFIYKHSDHNAKGKEAGLRQAHVAHLNVCTALSAKYVQNASFLLSDSLRECTTHIHSDTP